jgi:hypothetical protein
LRILWRGELVVAANLLVLGTVDLGEWLGITNIVLLMTLVGWPAVTALLLGTAGLIAKRPAKLAYWSMPPSMAMAALFLPLSYAYLDAGWDVAVLLLCAIPTPLAILVVVVVLERPRLPLRDVLWAGALFGGVGVVLDLSGVHLAVLLAAAYGVVTRAELGALISAYPPDPEVRGLAADGVG